MVSKGKGEGVSAANSRNLLYQSHLGILEDRFLEVLGAVFKGCKHIYVCILQSSIAELHEKPQLKAKHSQSDTDKSIMC